MKYQAIPVTSKAGPARSIAPDAWEVVALMAITLVGGALTASGLHEIVNVLLPLALGAAMGIANWRVARSNPATVLTPLFAFRTAVLAFFSLGSLAPYIVGASVADYLYALYFYSPSEAAKTNLIWAACTTLAIATCRVLESISSPMQENLGEVEPQGLTAIALGSLFFLVGFTVAVAISLAVALQLMEAPPNMVSLPFEAASGVGVFLIALHAIRRGGGWYLAILAIIVVNLAAGLILYNKSLVLFPLLFVCLALMVDRITLGRALFVAVTMFLALSVLQPAVARARDLHTQTHGGLLIGGTLNERASNALAYWRDPPEVTPEDRGQALSRLSFLSVGSYLVTQYDLGLPGSSIALAGYALIPRIIWPDKPQISSMSNDLSYEITRLEANNLAPTVPIDLYWNFGWLGVALLSPLIGALLWIGSRTSYRIVRRQDWFMMPFVLLAFRIGLSADSHFVLGIVTPAAAAAIAYYLLRAAKTLVVPHDAPAPRRRAGRRPAAGHYSLDRNHESRYPRAEQR